MATEMTSRMAGDLPLPLRSELVLRRRIELFVPGEVLEMAEPEQLEHWREQVRALVVQGWEVRERFDVERWGRVLTLICPEDAE